MSKIKGLENSATEKNVNLRELRKADYRTGHILITYTPLKQLCKMYVRGEHLKWNVDKIENPRIMGLQTNSPLLKMSFTGRKEIHHVASRGLGRLFLFHVLRRDCGFYDEKGEIIFKIFRKKKKKKKKFFRKS